MNRLTELRRKIQALENEPEKAIEYMKEAASLHDYNSIRVLVSAYTHGEFGLPADPQEAFRYTVLGAQIGEGWCLYNAAVCMRQGIGTDVDLKGARKWMLQAAEAGQQEAYLPAAEMLSMGEGGQPDFKGARHWCRQAIEAGTEPDASAAARLLGTICNEEGIFHLRKGDHSRAKFLFQEGMDLGNADCTVNLAYEYSIENDRQQTFALSLKAADAGQPLGMYNVSMCYREGHGVSRDARQAFEWMRNAAKTGFDEAWMPLAQHYLYGVGVNPSLEQALGWARKAEAAGKTNAHALVQEVLQQMDAS